MLGRGRQGIAEVEPGRSSVVSRVTRGDSDVVRYLGDVGIFPEVRNEVLERVPLAGTVTIRVDGKSIALGRDVARCIFVSKEAQGG